MKSISKEEINLLPAMEFHGDVELIQDTEHAIAAARALAHEPALGFDTETRPSFHADQQFKVSLLQLATGQKAYLFRLHYMEFPPELAAIMSNEKIVKVGVAIRDDVKALQKLCPFEPRGFFDLADEARRRGITSFGLRGLAAIYLEQRIMKGAKLTNWDQRTLTPSQISYAAVDALAGLQIYQKMFASRDP
jgi:ribonuclease D